MSVRPKAEPREFIETTLERLGHIDAANLSVDARFKHREQLEFLDDIRSGATRALAPGVALEQALHPIQVWFILPLCALANAFADMLPATLARCERSSPRTGVS